jgi:sodium/hydrogen antiporter
MVWSELEPNEPHLTYIILSAFLIFYALFSLLIRNRLHLSEPPLALAVGIIFGPKCAGVLYPAQWGLNDTFMQEFTRIVLCIQVFVIGIELPTGYLGFKQGRKHWASLAVLLGPVMAFGWVMCAALIRGILRVDFRVALVISACLTPTDPVLASSVLANSQFSSRVPRRIRNLLSAESGCNDGTSFPYLFIGLYLVTSSSFSEGVKEWFCITLLWQCIFGIVLGFVIGLGFNRILRLVHAKHFIGRASYLVFYLLLAIFIAGVSSSLGTDDFLVAFSAGAGFNHDGWFRRELAETRLPHIIDLILNSTMFVYFGAVIPWDDFVLTSESTTARLTPGLLVALLVAILALRRLPVVILAKRFIPDLKTYGEALFAGHFGPMGVGALFLAMEARAHLETEGESSEAEPSPSEGGPEYAQLGIDFIWPVVCFIVFGSTLIHGLSTLIISVGSHVKRDKEERAPVIGDYEEGLSAMVHDEDEDEEEEAEEEQFEKAQGQTSGRQPGEGSTIPLQEDWGYPACSAMIH